MRRKFGPVFEFSVQWPIFREPDSDSGLISWKPKVDQIIPKCARNFRFKIGFAD